MSTATFDVVLHLINSKCVPVVPVLLNGLEVCPLNKADMQSLNFCVNRLLKYFVLTTCQRLKNVDIIVGPRYRVNSYVSVQRSFCAS